MQVHVTDYGTYHPTPHGVAWTITWSESDEITCDNCGCTIEPGEEHLLCLDGGETLCLACGEAQGLEIVPCDCP